MELSMQTKTFDRLICELENPYPKDNLITCYKDFLNTKDYLSYYQFNPVVFHALLELTVNLWETKSRISRLSLLGAIKKYGLGIKEYATLDIQTRKLLFVLFRNTVEKTQFLTEKQIEEARIISYSFIKKLPLCSEEETWLCENENKSSEILNRILRYPVRSNVISRWIEEHFNDDKFRTRRAEAIAWLLDENPDYVINKQILFADFEYINRIDSEIILSNRDSRVSAWSSGKYSYNTEKEGKLTYRPYITLSYLHKPGAKPDFSALRKYFNENIDIISKQTMLWAVAYSRLKIDQKTELLKKYYSDELFISLIKICKKCKLIEVLKWLQTKTIKQTQEKLFEIQLGNEIDIDRIDIGDILTYMGKRKDNIPFNDDCPF